MFSILFGSTMTSSLFLIIFSFRSSDWDNQTGVNQRITTSNCFDSILFEWGIKTLYSVPDMFGGPEINDFQSAPPTTPCAGFRVGHSVVYLYHRSNNYIRVTKINIIIQSVHYYMSDQYCNYRNIDSTCVIRHRIHK